MKKHKKQCAFCGITFYAKRNDAKNCSSTCRVYYNESKQQSGSYDIMPKVAESAKTEPKKLVPTENNIPKNSNDFIMPDKLAQKMVGLAYKYGYKQGQPVLNLSANKGEFLKYFSKETPITTIEMSLSNNEMLQTEYPKTNHIHGDFENVVFDNNFTKYELVISNPPLGEFKREYSEIKCDTFTDYYILRGLDVLNPNGLLVYCLISSITDGEEPWLDTPNSQAKESILQHANLLVAYRLPDRLIENKIMGCDFIVFKKNNI